MLDRAYTVPAGLVVWKVVLMTGDVEVVLVGALHVPSTPTTVDASCLMKYCFPVVVPLTVIVLMFPEETGSVPVRLSVTGYVTAVMLPPITSPAVAP